MFKAFRRVLLITGALLVTSQRMSAPIIVPPEDNTAATTTSAKKIDENSHTKPSSAESSHSEFIESILGTHSARRAFWAYNPNSNHMQLADTQGSVTISRREGGYWISGGASYVGAYPQTAVNVKNDIPVHVEWTVDGPLKQMTKTERKRQFGPEFNLVTVVAPALGTAVQAINSGRPYRIVRIALFKPNAVELRVSTLDSPDFDLPVLKESAGALTLITFDAAATGR